MKYKVKDLIGKANIVSFIRSQSGENYIEIYFEKGNKKIICNSLEDEVEINGLD